MIPIIYQIQQYDNQQHKKRINDKIDQLNDITIQELKSQMNHNNDVNSVNLSLEFEYCAPKLTEAEESKILINFSVRYQSAIENMENELKQKYNVIKQQKSNNQITNVYTTREEDECREMESIHKQGLTMKRQSELLTIRRRLDDVKLPFNRNRNIFVAPASIPIKPPDEEIFNDEFYEVTDLDSQLYADSIRRSINGNTHLLNDNSSNISSDINNSKNIQRSSKLSKDYNFTVLRIRCPNHLYVDGTFKVTETVSDLENFILSLFSIDLQLNKIELFITPPKLNLLNISNSTFFELGLLPSAIVHLTIAEIKKDSLLNCPSDTSIVNQTAANEFENKQPKLFDENRIASKIIKTEYQNEIQYYSTPDEIIQNFIQRSKSRSVDSC